MMKIIRSHIFFLVAAAGYALALSVGLANGQSAVADPKPQASPTPTENRPNEVKFNYLAQLGLSPDQISQIRRINSERRPLMLQAQARLREANRALDQAIYADEVNDAQVDDRLKAVQAAQAEVLRIRSINEYSIRKILLPDQLVKFRDLRARFEEMRKNMELRRRRDDPAADGGGEPAKRFLPRNQRKLPGKRP